MYSHLTDIFPPVTRTPQSIEGLRGGYIGLDWEWDIRTGKPTILGMSDGYTHVSAPADACTSFLKNYVRRYPDTIYVGHNFIDADLPFVRDLGCDIPLANVEDTIIHHWLNNPNLCKGMKTDDGDEGDKRGRGFMNMWTMNSIYTDFPNHKNCREGECTGPCPDHDPFWYNAMDCYTPMVALPKMMRLEQLRGTAKLYPLHRDLMYVLGKWSRSGTLINGPYVEKMRRDFDEDKQILYNKELKVQAEGALPFNPDSPKQVKEYFKSRKIFLENGQEQTIREAVEANPADDVLRKLLDFKELGDGADRWYAPRVWTGKDWTGFMDADNFIHPHFGPYTSSGRLQCAGPNMQNVAKRRIDRKTKENVGKRVRRAVIAPEGHLLYRADYKNAENRVYLHLAGYKNLPPTDFHSEMSRRMNIKADDPFALANGGPRDAAKTVTHAADYLEGIQLMTRQQLRSVRTVKEIAVGARMVFEDWIVFDKIVTFNGINLAERAFGSATFENRARALKVHMDYFNGFPKMRGLQQDICTQCERDSAVILPHGYYIPSYGYELDRLKAAASYWGSNPVAHYMKIACIRADAHPRLRPVLTIHDEIVFYVDCRYEPTEVKKWIEECMVFSTSEIPDLQIPIDVGYSKYDETREVPESNWADLTTIE